MVILAKNRIQLNVSLYFFSYHSFIFVVYFIQYRSVLYISCLISMLRSGKVTRYQLSLSLSACENKTRLSIKRLSQFYRIPGHMQTVSSLSVFFSSDLVRGLQVRARRQKQGWLSRLSTSVTRVADIFVSPAFRSTDQEKRETARSLSDMSCEEDTPAVHMNLIKRIVRC